MIRLIGREIKPTAVINHKEKPLITVLILLEQQKDTTWITGRVVLRADFIRIDPSRVVFNARNHNVNK